MDKKITFEIKTHRSRAQSIRALVGCCLSIESRLLGAHNTGKL